MYIRHVSPADAWFDEKLGKDACGNLSTIPSPTQKANIYNAKSATEVGVY